MINFAVVIPIHHEYENKFFTNSINNLKNGKVPTILVKHTEIKEPILQNLPDNFHILHSPSHKRGAKLNYAIEQTNFNYYIFHHPRSTLDPRVWQYLRSTTELPPWGAFTHTFNKSEFFYNLTSFYSNYIRGGLFQIYYLDHCLFCSRKLLDQIGGFPALEIFEDTVFSQKLSKLYLPHRLPFKSITSDIRFEKNGRMNQGLKNFKLKMLFLCGYFNDKKFNQEYEENLNLNNSVEIKVKELSGK